MFGRRYFVETRKKKGFISESRWFDSLEDVQLAIEKAKKENSYVSHSIETDDEF